MYKSNNSLNEILSGNQRFISKETKQSLQKFETGQSPSTVVVSCADSRLNPNIIFDQSLGNIFSIRSAGGILDQTTQASIYFALDVLKCSNIIYIAHTDCGAMSEVVLNGTKNPNLTAITEPIQEVCGHIPDISDATKQWVHHCHQSLCDLPVVHKHQVTVISGIYSVCEGVFTILNQNNE